MSNSDRLTSNIFVFKSLQLDNHFNSTNIIQWIKDLFKTGAVVIARAMQVLKNNTIFENKQNPSTIITNSNWNQLLLPSTTDMRHSKNNCYENVTIDSFFTPLAIIQDSPIRHLKSKHLDLILLVQNIAFHLMKYRKQIAHHK